MPFLRRASEQYLTGGILKLDSKLRKQSDQCVLCELRGANTEPPVSHVFSKAMD